MGLQDQARMGIPNPANYVQGMRCPARKINFERNVSIEYWVTNDGTTVDKAKVANDLDCLSYHALLLWREAGSPDDFMAHLGPFIRVRKIANG